jgi:hypothetical protein
MFERLEGRQAGRQVSREPDNLQARKSICEFAPGPGAAGGAAARRGSRACPPACAAPAIPGSMHMRRKRPLELAWAGWKQAHLGGLGGGRGGLCVLGGSGEKGANGA